MNEIERRLRDAMAARADEVEPQDERDALTRITGRVNMNRGRNLAILGVAAAIFVVAGALVLLTRGDDEKNVNIGTGSTASSSSSSSSTTDTTVPVVVVPTEGPTPIWPFASATTRFATPEDAAKSFAVDYLGMTNARTGQVRPPADAKGASAVEIFPNDRGSARTLVNVEERRSGWVVVSADADQIEVDAPRAHDPVTSPINLAGRSVAFEAQVGVELRPFGSLTPVASGSVMGGSSEMQPFAGSIDPPSTDQPLVLLLFEGDASGEQTYTKATVIPLDVPGAAEPTKAMAVTANGDSVTIDFVSGTVSPGPPFPGATSPALPSEMDATVVTDRGRFGTVAFFNGQDIASYNPTDQKVVRLVTPAAAPTSLDADESGRFLLWVDVNHDMWKWSGADAVKVGSGFTTAIWAQPTQ